MRVVFKKAERALQVGLRAYPLLSEALLGVEETAEAVQGAGFPEHDKRFEQRWTRGLAGENRPQQHEVILDRPLLVDAELLKRGFKVFEGERCRFEQSELFGSKGERLFERALFGDEDLGRGHDVVLEEEVGHVAELGERFDAGLDERRDAAEIVVGEDSLAECLEVGFGRKRAEVLTVEPLELGQVEDRAAERDLFEYEALKHLWEREYLESEIGGAIVAPLASAPGGHASAH